MTSKKNKRVHFANKPTIFEYYQEIPCAQEYNDIWNESAKIYLQQKYMNENNGSLEGFDYSKEEEKKKHEDLFWDILCKEAEIYHFSTLKICF